MDIYYYIKIILTYIVAYQVFSPATLSCNRHAYELQFLYLYI